MLKKVLLGLLAVILVLTGYAALKPSDYRISREIVIHAPATRIFPYLNQSKLLNAWGPWSEIDPKAKMTVSGPEAGVGARTSWEDGDQLGTGSSEIIESVPDTRVITRLEYVKPQVMHQVAEFAIRAGEGGASVVVWTVTGQNSFPGRVVCLFMNMDKMVGGFFEKGLQSLKQMVEKEKS